jgi:DNA-binding MarR family transcriptional regulator
MPAASAPFAWTLRGSMPRKPDNATVPAKRNGDAPIHFGPLEHWLGFNLRMAQAAAFQAFARRSSNIGVQPGRFATLTLIAANPGITQTALSKANGRDKSTLTPLISDLVRRRLVQRTRDRTDRRTYRLALTSAGKRLLGELTACARAHEDAMDRLVGRDRTRFLQLLKKISAELV